VSIAAYNQDHSPLILTAVSSTATRDGRAEWHRNYTPIDRWFRAHLLRCLRDSTHKDLVDVLNDNPGLAATLGFYDGKASAIDEYDETGHGHGLPAPDRTFVPGDDTEVKGVDEDDPAVRELTTQKAGSVWKHAKPFITDYWYLKRHHNWQVPEHTFFDAQAHMAVGEDLLPETGVGNLEIDGDHDRVHYPSTHRRELKKFSTSDIREMQHDVASELVQRARRDGELVGELKAAIDSGVQISTEG